MVEIEMIPLAEIKVGERQRKVFNESALAELTNDIEENGLIHPLTVSRDQSGGYNLVAGERRLRALRLLEAKGQEVSIAGRKVQEGCAPCLVIDSSDTLRLFEIELNENLIRADLTWQEQTEAIASLHNMRKEQNPDQTYKDTADEVARIQGTGEESSRNDQAKVKRAVLTSKFMDVEEVRKASNQREAFKRATELLEAQFARSRVRVEDSANPHTLLHGDVRVLAGQLESGKYTTLITDPPYGLGVKSFGNASQLTHSYSEDEAVELYELTVEIATRVCTDEAHVFIFCDLELFHKLREDLTKAGWKVRRTPLIWGKGNHGHLADGDVLGFRRTYEFIVAATRGGKPYNFLENDILQFNLERDRYHAAQKPLDLYAKLIEISSDYGDHILDLFAGSGVIFGACKEKGRIATGIELDEKAVSLIETRQKVDRQ